MLGVIRYDETGKPICEICNKSFHRLMSHVRQKHHISEREYKVKFGLDLHKGICSIESSNKSRTAVLNNYESIIIPNLIAKGSKTRFKKGSDGRTKEKVSPQTKIALQNHINSSKMKLVQKQNGKLLGLSGLGNKTRWADK